MVCAAINLDKTSNLSSKVANCGYNLLTRDGPLEITGGGVTIPKQKFLQGKLLFKKILQAVIPKNNKSYALEKKFLQTSGLLKKLIHQTFFPPVISNSPSLI